MKVILNFAVVVGVDVVAEGVFGIPHTWDSSIVWLSLSLGRFLTKYSISDIASESDRRELSDAQKKSTQGLVAIDV